MNGNKNRNLSNLTLLFQSAITLSNHEGDLIWSRFSAFIVANTILFTLIGIILETSNRNIPIWVISIIGFIVTFLWFLSTTRGFEAIDYWNCSAREIEEEILGKNPKINLFIRGEKYFKHDREVNFTFGDKKENPLQRGRLTRCIPLHTRWTAYLSIVLILGLYFIIFVLSVFGLLPYKT